MTSLSINDIQALQRHADDNCGMCIDTLALVASEDGAALARYLEFRPDIARHIKRTKEKQDKVAAPPNRPTQAMVQQTPTNPEPSSIPDTVGSMTWMNVLTDFNTIHHDLTRLNRRLEAVESEVRRTRNAPY